MTPEEFHAMQSRVEMIRRNGIEFYARVSGRRAELGAAGRQVAAEFFQAEETALAAHMKLQELRHQWGKLYGWPSPDPMRTGSVNVDPNGKTIRTAEIDGHPY